MPDFIASDLSNLTVAQQLCTCTTICTTQCHVCYSPTWAKYDCVQQLWEHARSDDANFIAPGPDGTVCENGCDKWSINSSCIQHSIAPKVEHFIEAMGDQLLPWQAQILRAFMGVPTK
jgi:hypothetical protein